MRGRSPRPGPILRSSAFLLSLLLAVSAQIPLAIARPATPALAAGTLADVYVSETGLDTNDGTSDGTAVATIHHGIELAADGGVVHVLPGVYYQSNILVDHPVTILGAPGDAAPGPATLRPIVDGTGAVYPFDGFDIADGVDDVTISGFEIRNLYNPEDNNGTGVAVQGYGDGAKSRITVSHNVFHDVGYGVLSGSDPWDYDNATNTDWTVERNVVEGFVIGIELSNTSNSVVRDNILHMTDGAAGGASHHAVTALWSYVWASQTGLTFSGNTIDGALDPDYTATAYPAGGYPALLVWVRDRGVTLSGLTIENNDFSGLTGAAPRVSLLDTATGHLTSATIGSNAFAPDASALTTAGVGSGGIPVTAKLDATDNFWGQAAGPVAGQVTGNVDAAHWISTFTPDTRTPGFWPLDVNVVTELPTGASVPVEIVDPDGHWAIDLDFADVTTGGVVTIDATTGLPAAPTGFVTVPGSAFYFDVDTNSVAFASARICIPYTVAIAPHVYHYTGTAWEDVTDSTPTEIAAKLACGTVTHFSGVMLGVDAYATDLTIDSDDPDPSLPGQDVDVHVTLDGGGADLAGETVEVTDGTGASCTATLVTAGTGSCTLTPTTGGYKTLTATYGGNGGLNLDPATATATHTVLPTASTIIYTGATYLAAAGTVNLAALVGSGWPGCVEARDVEFWLDANGDGNIDDPGDTQLGATVQTNASGVATSTTNALGAGISELIVYTPGTISCEPALNTATVVIAGTGDKSNGGGWYTKSGRVSFGFTVQVKTNPKTGAVTVSGQLVWQANGKYRVKGAVTSYTQITCPTEISSVVATATCGYLAGTANLYSWSDGTGWILIGPIGYRVTVGDGGTSQVCTISGKKKTCNTQLKPDFFGMDLPTLTLAPEGIVQLKGGNLVVK